MALSLHQDLTCFELQNHFAFVAEIVRWSSHDHKEIWMVPGTASAIYGTLHDQKVHSSNISARLSKS